MKKAIVVGGSNGIGLAIAKKLIADGYFVHIFDRTEPQKESADPAGYEYIPCNLLDFSTEIFTQYAKDSSVELLMITAGFGRVCDFEYLHPAEIDNLFKVNSAAAIKIISAFYDRIKATEPFYCGVMGSIAGLVSSPMFSVYAATKAALCRFTESVNVELEAGGTANRILNVSPGSIKGTRFNGGENDDTGT